MSDQPDCVPPPAAIEAALKALAGAPDDLKARVDALGTLYGVGVEHGMGLMRGILESMSKDVARMVIARMQGDDATIFATLDEIVASHVRLVGAPRGSAPGFH